MTIVYAREKSAVFPIVHGRPRRLVPFVVATISVACLSSPAFAQTADQQSQSNGPSNAGVNGAQADAPVPAAPVTPVAPASPNASSDLTQIEKLGWKGWDTPFPRVADTIFRDDGGVRSKLSDLGIWVMAYSLNSTVYDVRNDHTPGAVFNGRRPTYFVGKQAFYLTFDTGKIGIPNGQIQVAGGYNMGRLTKVNGPRYLRFANLAYFQSLAHDKIEFKIGYFTPTQEFIGTQVGGSLVSGTLGPQAQIPVELGLAYGGLAAPSADIRFNLKNHFYVKSAISRSLPNGGIRQVLAGDNIGLRFSYPAAKPLYVTEVGLNRPASATEMSLWIRAGGIYNTTNYRNYKTGGRNDNWGAYAAIDKQLTKVSPSSPSRGLYVGASVNYAPPDKNLFTQYYEGRIYGVGIIQSRPGDLASLVVSYNKVSHDVIYAISPTSQDYAVSAIASYSYRLMHGLYVQPGVGLVKNPTLAPKVPLSVNGYFSVSALF